MAKSIRSKREKRLRAIRRDLVEPYYEKKDAAKLSALEAALAAPKLPVKQSPFAAASSAAMDVTTTTSTAQMDVEMDDESKINSLLRPVGKKLKKKFQLGRNKRKGKGTGKGVFRKKHIYGEEQHKSAVSFYEWFRIGKLERSGVLKAVCAGFKETKDPPLCLGSDVETNECLERNGGCWEDKKSNITACKDTFRGRVCECPVVRGVHYAGDGYISCTAVGPGRCAMGNAGCWSETRDGLRSSACSEHELSGCQCPQGFHGDGYNCEDVNECKALTACQCHGFSCKNTWGSYECKCKGGLIYIKEQDACIERRGSGVGWYITAGIVAVLAGAGVAGYIFYKYRLRSYMDSEIMAIMSQYMPLDNHQKDEVPSEFQPLRNNASL